MLPCNRVVNLRCISDSVLCCKRQIYNVSREFCDPALGCTIEQYNRGTIAPIFTLGKPAEGIPADDAWTQWPGYPKCLGLGDTFATSLYSVPEYETTREGFRKTFANAQACNISWVTPVTFAISHLCRQR